MVKKVKKQLKGPSSTGDMVFWTIVGIIVVLAAVVWLGNEMTWWQITFPFWPVIGILVGIAIIGMAIKAR
ncbi:MAG: hypothetical protein ACXABY_03210 [Candidatus Thorarchaeota archaeon]|jgi:hypothetical protein